MTSQSVFKGFNMANDALSFPSVDLSGKLIIKAQLDDDIRRIPIHNEEITCDELLIMMQRVFSGRLSPRDDVVLKYKDEDGDLITIADNADLTLAKQTNRVLRIVVLVNGQVKPYDRLNPDSVHNVKKELVEIRDCVNGLLDQLGGLHMTTPTVEPKGQKQESPTPHAPAPELKPASVDSTMFDPLKSEEKPKLTVPSSTENASTPQSEAPQSSQVYQQQPQLPSASSGSSFAQPQPTPTVDPYQQQQQQVVAQVSQHPSSTHGDSYSAVGASAAQAGYQSQPGYQGTAATPSQYVQYSTPTGVQQQQQQQPQQLAYQGYSQAQQQQQQQPVTSTHQPPPAGNPAQAYGYYTQQQQPQAANAANPYSRKGVHQQQQQQQPGYNTYGQQHY